MAMPPGNAKPHKRFTDVVLGDLLARLRRNLEPEQPRARVVGGEGHADSAAQRYPNASGPQITG